MFCFYGYGDHRYLHVLTHSFPTRRSSDLRPRRRQRQLAVAAERGALTLDPADCRAHALGFSWRTCARTLLRHVRSEEHTSELQSLMRISYAVFCLKKKSSVDV